MIVCVWQTCGLLTRLGERPCPASKMVQSMKRNMRDRPPIQTVGKGEATIVPINHRGAAVQNRARSQLDPYAYPRKLGGCFGTSRAVLRRVLASSNTPTGSKPPLKVGGPGYGQHRGRLLS
jgi:hypothetical protein